MGGEGQVVMCKMALGSRRNVGLNRLSTELSQRGSVSCEAQPFSRFAVERWG